MPRPAYLRNLVRAPASSIAGRFKMNFTGAGVTAVTSRGEGGDGRPTTSPNGRLFPHDGTNSATCTVNGITFQRGAPIGRMAVNTVQEWEMANVAGHPLHLHVNPFQLTEVAASRFSPTAMAPCDAEYGYACVGDWLDTLQLPGFGKSDARFRFVTDTFTGHEVMHCHYLNHEDLGCMAYFDIQESGEAALSPSY